MTSSTSPRNSSHPIASFFQDTFTFPHPVNEIAARWVAGMVVVLALGVVLSNVYWLMFVLTYGFLARVLAGPKLSPMGLLATRLFVPRLGNPTKMVAGPPKRFAQAVGLVFSVTALILVYGFGMKTAAEVVLGVLALFAALESFVGFCTGCFVFGCLIKWGLVPEKTCKRCADIWAEV
jgi:hypothetical protein